MGIFAASSTIFFSLSNLLSSLAVTIFIFLCLDCFARLSTLSSRVSVQFGSALNALLNQALFGHRPVSFPSHHELGAIGFDSSEAAECVVCLCEIEQGEEVRELKCQHRFHRVCLEQWMNHSNHTCPLCRGYVGPMYEELTGRDEEVEVVYFRRFSLISSDDAETADRWWLR